MRAFLLHRAVPALMLAFGLAANPAVAQNYDGAGLLKFGVFGQYTKLDFGVTQPGTATVDSSGGAAGLSFGFDMRTPHGFLYGIEVDGSFGDARGSALGTNLGFDYLVTARGRAGFYAHPSLLVYGTAGLALLGFEGQSVNGGLKGYETLNGWTVGGGLEWEWHQTLLFTEYLYTSHGAREFNVDGVRHEADADTHLVRFGIKFKTGHDHYHGGILPQYEPLK